MLKNNTLWRIFAANLGQDPIFVRMDRLILGSQLVVYTATGHVSPFSALRGGQGRKG